jgi:hypothetical protein
MNSTTTSNQMFNALLDTASRIKAVDSKLGFYARRKVDAVSAQSDLKVLIQVAEDMLVIARLAGINS